MRRSSNPRTAKFQIRDNTFNNSSPTTSTSIHNSESPNYSLQNHKKMPTKLTLHRDSKGDSFRPCKFNTYTDQTEIMMENELYLKL